MTRFFIENQIFTLGPSQLIQSGGEGMVFALGKEAVKIYHRPSPAQHTKLRDWIKGGFNNKMPSNVLGPGRLVLDLQRQFVGFQMPRLSTDRQPLKRLSQSMFWQRNNLKTIDVITLFKEIHATLSQIHRQGVIVGDLSDTNLFFRPPVPENMRSGEHTQWVDVDSYQFGGHPCPVAQEAFLDPTLHGVTDLGQRAYFTVLTDWYAFLTLFVKSLLQVHPYGGVHHRYKTIQARARAGIAVVNSAITYPQMARPRESLSDDLLHHIHLVYEKGQRMPFPSHLLDQYADSLIACGHCGLAYPIQRRGCPACRRKTPGTLLNASQQRLQKRLLLQSDGFVSYVAILNSGRIVTVLRVGSEFRLVKLGVGGVIENTKLSTGQANYQFGFFEQAGGGQYLVVNPHGSQQLLVLDISGSQPQHIEMLETAMFRGEAVFATTNRYLYRIAGNWIMRGCLQDGHYLEDAIATAHRAQTQFWGSPQNDVIAGYHRVFAEHRFFLIDSGRVVRHIALPPLVPGEAIAETKIAFGRNTVAIILMISHQGRLRVDTFVSDMRGKIQYRFSRAVDPNDGLIDQSHQYPFTAHLTRPSPPFIHLPPGTSLKSDAVYRFHPNGILIQQANRLYLISKWRAG